MLSALRGRVTGACTPSPVWLFVNMKQVRLHWVYSDSDGMSMAEVFAVLMSPYEELLCPLAVLKATCSKELWYMQVLCLHNQIHSKGYS